MLSPALAASIHVSDVQDADHDMSAVAYGPLNDSLPLSRFFLVVFATGYGLVPQLVALLWRSFAIGLHSRHRGSRQIGTRSTALVMYHDGVLEWSTRIKQDKRTGLSKNLG